MRPAAAFCVVVWLAASVPSVGRAAERPPSNNEAPVLFTADQVQYDQDLGLVVARGNVELSQKDQILLADTVTYNQRTDTVTASGHVSLLEPTGDIIFADFVELHDNLRDGFIKNVRMLLSDRSRMAGNTARRVGGTRTEIRRAVYSPCDLCREDPTRAPLWQIEAENVVHDKELHILEYHDAYMEIAGVPVFYMPYFSHPDPSVKRQSGFLAPTVGSSSSIGFHFSLPYYWVIGPDKDATFRPIFTTGGGTVLAGEYRQRFGFGHLETEGSIALGSEKQTGDPFNPNPPTSGLRGHVFSNGQFDINDNWRAGFDVQRASDPTYLLRYHFASPTNFLTSHVYAEDFGPRSYGNISAYAFQSLDPTVSDSTQPFAAPIANYDWTSDPDRLGGRWHFNGNALNLLREQGTAIRRLSVNPSWQLPFFGPIGDHYTFTAHVRGDSYYSTDVLLAPTDTMTHSELAGRFFPQAALTWRYPWVRRGESTSALIEPIAALIAAPVGENPATIPNEDSQGFEFDDTSLFRLNRFPGYDRVDSGQRVDYGVRAGIYNDTLGSSQLLVGQSYRFQKSSAFPVGSGLEYQRSDVVGRVVVSPNSYLDLFYRFRLDHDDLALRRQEVGLSTGPSNLRLGLSYTSFTAQPGVSAAAKASQITTSLNLGLTRYWSLAATDSRNVSGNSATLNSGDTVNSGVALTYRDECLTFSASVVQSGIRVGDVHPGVSVLFTLVFKNLGEVGVRTSPGG
jgi:LPS-assembly protein